MDCGHLVDAHYQHKGRAERRRAVVTHENEMDSEVVGNCEHEV